MTNKELLKIINYRTDEERDLEILECFKKIDKKELKEIEENE